MKKYDVIFSLGAACSATQTLRHVKFQRASYPLDWVFGAGFARRVDMLVSGFERFMEMQDLKYSFSERSIRCDAYQNTHTDLTFNHDFAVGVPLEESYPAVKEKYDRRIARLLRTIERSRSVLVFYMEAPEWAEQVPHEQLIAAYHKICARFPGVNVDMLYVSTDESLPVGAIRRECLVDGLTKMTANYRSQLPDAHPWEVDFDVTSQFLQGRALKLFAACKKSFWARCAHVLTLGFLRQKQG